MKALVNSISAASCLLLLAAGCGGSDSGSAADTKVKYLTSFGTFGREAYVYVAIEKGYFERAGIDVDVKPGSGTVDVLKLIASGRADFGPGDFTSTVITIAKEKLPVTAVAAVHQRSLAALVALEGSGIARPKDLEGKKVGDQPGSTNQVMFPVYAKAAGVDAAKVKFVPAAPPALPQLLVSGKVNAIGQFVVGKPTIEKAARGRKAVVLPYGDYLKDLYGNVLATATKTAKERPDLVKKFRDALLKGLEYAVDHPDEAGRILKKNQPTQDAAVAAAELKEMAPYVRSAGSPAGALDRARVESTLKILTSAGAIPTGAAADRFATFGLAPGA